MTRGPARRGAVIGQEDEYDRTANFVTELALLANGPDNRCIRNVLAALPDVESVRRDRSNKDSMCFPDFRKCRRMLREGYRAE